MTFKEPEHLSVLLQYTSYHYSLIGLALILGVGFTLTVNRFINHRSELTLPLHTTLLLVLAGGFLTINAVLFVLGMTRLFNGQAMIIAFSLLSILSVAVCFVESRAFLSLLKPNISWVEGICYLALLICMGTYLLFSYIPIQLSDATAYHLPVAEHYLKHQRFEPNFHLIYPYHSHNFNIMYSLMMLFSKNAVFLQSIHAMFAAFTGLAIYSLARTLKLPVLLAILAGTFYTFSPASLRISGIANVDNYGIFFLTACLTALFLWQQNRNSKQLLFFCSAAFLGIAMGTKYIFSLYALPIALIILFEYRKECLPRLIRYGLISAAFGLWWYVRSMLLTGNPVHPFASGIFPNNIWEEHDYLAQLNNLSTSLIPRTFEGFILAPDFMTRGAVAMLGAEYWIAGLYASILFIKWLPKQIRYLMIWCFSFWFFWFFFAQMPRYLGSMIPGVIILTLSLPYFLLYKIACLTNWYKSTKHILYKCRIIIGLITITLTITAMWLISEKHIKIRMHTVSNGLFYGQQMKELKVQADPTYALIQIANDNFTKDETLFLFSLRRARYEFHGNAIGAHFGEHGFINVLRSCHVSQELPMDFDCLKKVLNNYQADGFIMAIKNHPLHNEPQYKKHFDLLYKNQAGSLYRIRKTKNQ